jgi:hypothetical protein
MLRLVIKSPELSQKSGTQKVFFYTIMMQEN